MWKIVGILCLLGSWALTASARDIQQITVQGNIVIPASTILARVESKVGLPYNPAIVTEDIQRIYEIGFFSTVEVDARETADGLELTYVVAERPIISAVEFQGNQRVKAEKFEDFLSLPPAAISNAMNLAFYPQKIDADRAALLEYYHSQGYQNARISSEIVPDPDAPSESVIVRYTIEEGDKAIVRRVSFEGNTVFTDEELRKVMFTRRRNVWYWFNGSGKYAEELLEADRRNVREFYRDHGYLDAQVVETDLEFREESRNLFITLTIDEGALYTVNEIAISGNTVLSDEDLHALLQLKSGDPFSPATIRADMFTIADEYSKRGYIQPLSDKTADKFLIEPDVRMNAEARQADLTYVISEGVPHRVNRIVITGNKNTRDKVIRREMSLHEGDVFSGEALRKSRQRVFNLALFDDVSVEMQDGAEPHSVDIVLNVIERYSIGSFNFGGGWDTVDAWTVSGGVSAENLFGLAHALDFSATFGSTSTLFSIDYTMPHVWDSPYTVGLDAYKQERDYSTYSKENSGGGIRFGRSITRNTMMFLKYRYEFINIFDVAEDASSRFKEAEGESSTSSVSLLLRRSTINNVLLPTQGMRTEVQGELAGGALGADNDFYKLTLSNNIYFPLYNDIALRLRGTYGFIEEYGDSDEVPIFERFYGGGATTIRGYKERSIGPKDEDEEPIGGSSRLVLSSEVIFPVQKDLRLLAFFDMGDVYGADESLDLSSLRKSVGAGLRLKTPFGLMRFDMGYKLDDAEVAEDDKNYEFHFGIGNIF